MTVDAELAGILARVVGPGERFGHRHHVHLAFVAVRRYGMPAAVDRVCGWLRQLTAYEKAPRKYHHTMSRAWVELVAYHVAEEPDGVAFAEFVRRHPALLDKRLLSRHYRSVTLAGDRARRCWVDPDVAAFPWAGGASVA
jgi:hypothetical protein